MVPVTTWLHIGCMHANRTTRVLTLICSGHEYTAAGEPAGLTNFNFNFSGIPLTEQKLSQNYASFRHTNLTFYRIWRSFSQL